MNTIELLAPAGSPEALDAAVGAGADAVYLGVKSFNARLRTSNFAYSQVEAAIRVLHRMKRRCYITVNTVFEQREADRMYQLLNYLARVGPDGLIVQDFGVAYMAQKYFPSLKLHASTQMNIASSRGANALSKRGISRGVLARELSLDEIKDIRSKTNTELEVFVHGALCISESGLCLFSSFLGGKSANRGMCTQACRRFYRSAETNQASGEGGYFFSPSDLQLIEKIPLLADAGVNAFKIEGRMKSADYAGTVVSAYRAVIDALGGNDDQIAAAIKLSSHILQNDFAREKTLFHFNANLDFLNPEQTGGTGIALGKILKVRGKGDDHQGLIVCGARELKAGDSIRIHKADDSERLARKLTSVDEEAPESRCWVSIPQNFGIGDEVFLIQTKAMSKRYPPVIPKNIDTFRRAPGREQAPVINLADTKRANLKNRLQGLEPPRLEKTEKIKTRKALPEGLYAAVSRTSDLYALQSIKPVKVLLGLTKKTLVYLLDKDKPPLPFHPSDIILVLDPYFPQNLETVFSEAIPRLCAEGYACYVVNNPAHTSLFRNSEATLIAGSYMYAFNRFAAAFIQETGVNFFISPLENNRQNLERTFEVRSPVFVTVFAYPALFRIRSDLSPLYKWTLFGDSQDDFFSLITEPDGSLVVPEKPFSIVDKIPFLCEAGFRRFILDFSGPVLKKRDYKTVMTAAKKGTPLPNTSRFNWKDGFYADTARASPGEPLKKEFASPIITS
jgi:putative protease